MEHNNTISFADNATTREAGLLALRYGYVFVRNLCRAVNVFAHRLPWLCMAMVAMVAMVVSFVHISRARAERDAASKRVVSLQQQVEQLQCAVEASKGER